MCISKVAFSSALLLAAAVNVATPALAQAPLTKLTVFATPGVTLDAMWMADAKGIYKEAGLDVQFRIFPSGTTAFQTFKTGAGDLITSGDLPGLQYWQNSNGDYRVVAAVQRDDRGYVVVTSKAIKEAKDLAGKTVATRVGSTGSWFVSEYLFKNKVDPASVTVKNLDPPNLPIALCRGDIDGFFIWQPNGWKAQELCGDKVHQLSNAVGYVRGYNILGARPGWLATPENADAATKFVAATRKGAEVAAKDFPEVAKYVQVKFGIDEKAAKEQYDLSERVLAIDQGFFDDFCSISKWLQRTGGATGPTDLSGFIWTDGLKKIDPKLVTATPPPC